MIKRRQKTAGEVIRELQAQNQQLAQLVMQERMRSQQLAQMIQGQSPESTQQRKRSDSPLGAYNQLWGNGEHKKNQQAYDGSAFRQLRR